MTFNEYVPLAIRTLNDLGSRKKNLAHMGLGIGNEMLEYQMILEGDKSDTILFELGDLSWFTASASHLLDIEYEQDKFGESNLVITKQLFTSTACSLVDLIKKHFAYGTPIIDSDKWIDRLYLKWIRFRGKKFIMVQGQLDYHIHVLVQCIRHFSTYHGLGFDHVLVTNIEKLKKRYPKGYSDYHATERFDKKAVSEVQNS